MQTPISSIVKAFDPVIEENSGTASVNRSNDIGVDQEETMTADDGAQHDHSNNGMNMKSLRTHNGIQYPTYMFVDFRQNILRKLPIITRLGKNIHHNWQRRERSSDAAAAKDQIREKALDSIRDWADNVSKNFGYTVPQSQIDSLRARVLKNWRLRVPGTKRGSLQVATGHVEAPARGQPLPVATGTTADSVQGPPKILPPGSETPSGSASDTKMGDNSDESESNDTEMEDNQTEESTADSEMHESLAEKNPEKNVTLEGFETEKKAKLEITSADSTDVEVKLEQDWAQVSPSRNQAAWQEKARYKSLSHATSSEHTGTRSTDGQDLASNSGSIHGCLGPLSDKLQEAEDALPLAEVHVLMKLFERHACEICQTIDEMLENNKMREEIHKQRQKINQKFAKLSGASVND